MRNNTNKRLVITVIVLLILTQIIVQAITIDTRFQSAVPSQQNQSFVFGDQQEFVDCDATYGQVEFVNGIAIRANNGPGICSPSNRSKITLGVTPSIGGTIRFTGGTGSPPTSVINVVHDLILTITAFELYPLHSKAGVPSLEFDIIQDPNDPTPNPPSIISIERNLTSTGGILFFSDNGGIVDGNNNVITIPPSQVVAGNLPALEFIGNAPGGLTIKNTKFIIQPNGVLALSGSSNFGVPTILDNVSILTFPTSEAFVVPFSSTPNFIFQGNDVIGDGAFIQFFSFPVSSPFKVIIDRESTLSILPNTTFNLTDYNLGGTTFGFYFKDSTSKLYLDNCTLSIGGIDVPFPGARSHGVTHMTFTAGTMIVNGNVKLIAGDPAILGPGGSGSSLQFGDGINPANNFNVIILPGSKLIVDDGMILINKNVDA